MDVGLWMTTQDANEWSVLRSLLLPFETFTHQRHHINRESAKERGDTERENTRIRYILVFYRASVYEAQERQQ